MFGSFEVPERRTLTTAILSEQNSTRFVAHLWPICGPRAWQPRLLEKVPCRLLTEVVEQWTIFPQTSHGQKLHCSQELQLSDDTKKSGKGAHAGESRNLY